MESKTDAESVPDDNNKSRQGATMTPELEALERLKARHERRSNELTIELDHITEITEAEQAILRDAIEAVEAEIAKLKGEK